MEECKLKFEKLLTESVRSRGHLCPGQALGVKMSLRGLREIGIQDPKCRQRKDIMVIVEIDRCVLDAVQSVIGCSPGRRTLKLMDYGKMATTFVNLKVGRSVRILARDDSRERAKEYAPDIEDVYAAQCEAYKVMSDEELFTVATVEVVLRPKTCQAGRSGASAVTAAVNRYRTCARSTVGERYCTSRAQTGGITPRSNPRELSAGSGRGRSG